MSSYSVCVSCRISTRPHFCWVHQQPRLCIGRGSELGDFVQVGHLHSPVCQICRQRAALIACYTESSKMCSDCFLANVCIQARHAVHVIPFSTHTFCAPYLLQPGAYGSRGGGRHSDGRGGGRGSDGRGSGRGDGRGGGQKRNRDSVPETLELLGNTGGAGPSQPTAAGGAAALLLWFYGSYIPEQITGSFRLPVVIDGQQMSSYNSETMVEYSASAGLIEKHATDVIAGSTRVSRTEPLQLSKSSAEALFALMQSATLSLVKILLRGDFSEYPLDGRMHCTERLAGMFDNYMDEVQAQPEDVTEFLKNECKIVEEFACVDMAEAVARSAFLAILSQRMDEMHPKPADLISSVWDYVEEVLSSVFTRYCDEFPDVRSSVKRAAKSLIRRMKEQSLQRVAEIVSREKLTDYTCNRACMSSWTQKMSEQQAFIDAVLQEGNGPACFSLTGFGDVDVSHLRNYEADLLQKAFGVKMKMSSYWPIVLQRLTDSMFMDIQLSLSVLLSSSHFLTEFLSQVVDLGGGGRRVEGMLPGGEQESEMLKDSMGLLKDAVLC
ncbi:unnamed protein product [Microthlaspi erraticum]|uniref:Dynamin stalk domain-containing protein n=1 Tax=Microthlaspi erraticum TaxID=1685480 RepID=A0A6D2L7X5_9BRAS|nr:unnamed protein product [Microthlaspi erraticum]